MAKNNEPEKRKRNKLNIKPMNNISEIDRRAEGVSKLSLVGASAMGFPDKISSVRSAMATRHTAQRVVLADPEFPMVYTGAENVAGELSSWNVKATDDYELIKTFRKFKDSPISPVVYLMKNLRTGKYKCEEVKPAENLTEKYGFRIYNKIANKFNDGDIIPKDTIISQTSSYVNDNYCAGRNIRCLYTITPEITEDALVISDEAAKKLDYYMVDIIDVAIKKDSFLLNKYGDDNLYKPFPNVGEEIQDDILCSIRENSFISSIKEAAIPHINDTNYYSNGGGTIVDIDIFTNIDVENDQFNYYHRQITEWYQSIYDYISAIVVDKSQDDTTMLDIFQRAEKYLSESIWVTKENIVDTHIRFTVLKRKHVAQGHGQKLTGRYGNKSVISKIVPQRLMPKTDDGRPIDMICNALSIPNRIISFVTYETSMTFMSERIWQHITEMNNNGESKEKIMDIVIEFISIFNPDQGNELVRLYEESPSQVFNDVINNGIYIHIPPFNEVCVRDALLAAYDKYPDILKPYKIYDKLRHRWVQLKGEYAVGYQYTWVLKQEASKTASAVSTGRTTLSDLPVKTSRYKNNLIPYSDNPIKYGEYDTYNFLIGVGVKAFAKLTTYFRGSQYEDNSILMSQLNNIGIDTSKYNQFPQLDNLKNILKLMGAKLQSEKYDYATIGFVDEIHEVMINNVAVNISIPELRYMLVMYSYYTQYKEYKGGFIDMHDFFESMNNTEVFVGLEKDYIEELYEKFMDMLPILEQLK